MVGSIFRYSISKFFTDTLISFPFGTLFVNLIGCFIAGIIFKLTSDHFNDTYSKNLVNLLVIGFCGGFTTFSAFSLDVMKLFSDERFLHALMYIFTSFLGAILAVWVGFLIAKGLSS